jgi:hypothetical protein
MTISDTAITINGDTAWLVVPLSGYHPNVATTYTHYNRPCDRCHGTGRMLEDDASRPTCPDCHGTGQHTFTLDVECGDSIHLPFVPDLTDDDPWYVPGDRECRQCDESGTRSLSVHVVAVLPIHDHCADYKPADHICRAWQDERWYWHRSDLGDRPTEEIVTLPPDAAPGMYAVRMEVHT